MFGAKLGIQKIITHLKVNIIGAGLSGITAAIVFKKLGHTVELFDQREHFGGNCRDTERGNILFHNYGAHILHTNDDDLFSFLNLFSAFRPFELKTKAETAIGRISIPYSRKTVSEIGRELSEEEIREYVFRAYSEKQWGVPLEEIPQSILARVRRTKDHEDPTWYGDTKHQCVPVEGYSRMMQAMLEGFKVNLGVSPDEWKKLSSDLLVYTGRVDDFFDRSYGALSYRSLKFETESRPRQLEHFIVNQNTQERPYTRMYDHSYFRENHSGPTLVTKETPFACGEKDEPFYPMPFGKSQNLYDTRYKPMADGEANVLFAGRLATYKYLNMDVAIKQVFAKTKTKISEFL